MLIPIDRIRPLANSLLARTKENQVNWHQVEGAVFRVSLQNASLDVYFSSPEYEADQYVLDILNASLESVTRWGVSQGEPDWPLLRDLFLEAQRCATKWDQVLGSIEKSLDSTGPIGNAAPF